MPEGHGTVVTAETTNTSVNTSSGSSANLSTDTLIDFAGAGHDNEEEDNDAALKVASVPEDNADADADDNNENHSQILLSPRRVLTNEDADHDHSFDEETINPNECLRDVMEDTAAFDKYQAAQNQYTILKKAMVELEKMASRQDGML